MKLGKAVVRSRVVILIIALALMVPSVIGMICTRVNYDMLNYLPESLDTVKGQRYMLEDFNKGAFSFLIFENADEKTMREASEKSKRSTMSPPFSISAILPTARFPRSCFPIRFTTRSIKATTR